MRFPSILALIIAILTLLFAAQNSALIAVRLGIFTFQASLALVVVVTLGLGFLVGLLVSLPVTLKRGWTATRRKKTINELEQELSHQRQIVADQKRRIEFLEQNLPQ